MANENTKTLDEFEKEFVTACHSYDTTKIIDILRQNKQRISFFCSVANIRNCQEEFRTILNDLPEDLKDVEGIIKRMTYIRKPLKNKNSAEVDQEIVTENLPEEEKLEENIFVIED